MTTSVVTRRGANAEIIQIIGMQHTAVSKSDADTNEGTLYTVTIPGGSMGPNGFLEVIALWTVPNSATTKTCSVYLGASQFSAPQLTTVVSLNNYTVIRNRNSQTSQITFAQTTPTAFTSNSNVNFTGTIDTSVDQTLKITGKWGTAGAGSNNITLESVIVRLGYGA